MKNLPSYILGAIAGALGGYFGGFGGLAAVVLGQLSILTLSKYHE